MISMRGLATSSLLHVLAFGMVLAAAPVDQREVIEDTPSIAVELLLDIESSPLASQTASDGAEVVEADFSPLEPAERAIRDKAPEPVERAAIEASPQPAPAMVDVTEPSATREPAAGDQPPAPVEPPFLVAALPPAPAMPEELMSDNDAADLALRDRPPTPVPVAVVKLQEPAMDSAGPAQKKKRLTERKNVLDKAKPKAGAAKTAAKKKPAQRAALASGKGSTGKTRTTDGSASDSSFKSKVLARLRAAKRYPDAARSKGIEGVAVLSFTINASGQLMAARIVKGSGHSLLDKATLAMARSAAPFPKIPANLGRGQMTFRVPVQFKVD